jgi:aminoglycoside 3-N-acetyltransferase
MVTAPVIAADLARLGVRSGSTLLVHSSLSSLGRVAGGPETVVEALLEALGPPGTLLMPALSYESVHADQPLFDLHATPSCVGAIPEYFRTRPGTLRSASPTHSVCAVGRDAAALVADQHLDDTPVGPRSPFQRLRDVGGQLLFLGCGMRPNTSMHGVEEVAGVPYLFHPEPVTYELHLPDGVHRVRVRRHAFVGWGQRYDRLQGLLAPGELRVGSVGAATAHLVEVPAMWARGLRALAEDPHFFVEARSD